MERYQAPHERCGIDNNGQIADLAFCDHGSEQSADCPVEGHSAGYADPVTFYVEKLVEGVATLGAAFWPKPVIVRLSDFKSNEYSSLTGGAKYEPREENPMLGFRGASRYISDSLGIGMSSATRSRLCKLFSLYRREPPVSPGEARSLNKERL